MERIKEKGFTLIEIITVIIILGIIALVAVIAVSQYLGQTETTVYRSYEKTMVSATKNKVVKCIAGEDNCILPKSGEKIKVQLKKLLEGGYLETLNIEKDGETCDSYLSYVEISKTNASGKGDYKYDACLYCGNYKSENQNCIVMDSNDVEPPTCGKKTGESTTWTKDSRTISVKCSDNTSCSQESFTKKFNQTAKTDNIAITDINGNQKQCSVNVYVDKTEPTCEIEVVGGQQEVLGWYSGTVTARIINMRDADSGLNSYGIGTSIENKTYDNKTDLVLQNGTTTVIGYVKDKVGNEGICAKQIKVGVPKPEIDFYYGYQIYPNKEEYNLSNLNVSGTTFTMTGTNGTINFVNTGRYVEVERVKIKFGSAVTKNTDISINYGIGTVSDIIPAGNTEKTILIPKGTYNTLSVTIGGTNGTSYNIREIEVLSKKGNLPTNKDVSVNIVPSSPVLPGIKYSFDGGATWQTSSSKEMSNNTNNNLKITNISGLTSNDVTYEINNIDRTKPVCSVVSTAYMKSNSQKLTGTCTDNKGVTKVVWVTNGIVPKESSFINVVKNVSVIEHNTITAKNTYTLFAMDENGNISDIGAGTVKILGYNVKNYYLKLAGIVSVYTTDNYVSESNQSYILPYNTVLNPVNIYNVPANSIYLGAGDLDGSTTPQVISTANRVLTIDGQTYSIWFDRTKLIYTIVNQGKGNTKITSLSNTTGTTIAPNSSGNLMIRYGESVVISPSSVPGSIFSGYVPTSPTTTNIIANQNVIVKYSECQAGTYSGSGATSCVACPSGYSNVAGITGGCWINVPAGKKIGTVGATTPVNCEAGSYSDAHTVYYGQTSSCSLCPSGYTSVPGSAGSYSCHISIPAGKYLASQYSTTPTDCPAGMYSIFHNVYYGNTSSCTSCPSGFTSDPGATSEKCMLS